MLNWKMWNFCIFSLTAAINVCDWVRESGRRRPKAGKTFQSQIEETDCRHRSRKKKRKHKLKVNISNDFCTVVLSVFMIELWVLDTLFFIRQRSGLIWVHNLLTLNVAVCVCVYIFVLPAEDKFRLHQSDDAQLRADQLSDNERSCCNNLFINLA